MKANRFLRNKEGALNVSSLLTIAFVIIGAVVGMALLAALLPTFFTSTGQVVGAVTSASGSVGNSTAGGLLPTFGLLVAFAAIFAVVGLIIYVVRIRRS